MRLLALALAFALGIVSGRWIWEQGWVPCPGPDWPWTGLWPLPALLFPLAHYLHHRLPQPLPLLRWPTWAGFIVPRPWLSHGMLLALGIASTLGMLRYWAHPLTPCPAATNLAAWAAPHPPAGASLHSMSNRRVLLEGHIAAYPVVADRRLRLEVNVHTLTPLDGAGVSDVSGASAGSDGPDEMHTIGVQGRTRLTVDTGYRLTDPSRALVYGQPIRIEGELVLAPPGATSSFGRYLAVHGIHTLVYNARIEPLTGPPTGSQWQRFLYQLRQRSEVLINRTLPAPHAALANGMILGIQADIPTAVYDQFNRTGTSHVIVISGANIAIVMTLFLSVGRVLLGRRAAIVLAVAAIGGYTVLVGGDAAVVRAAIMGSLGAVALGLGRPRAALVSLAAAGWLMLLVRPVGLWDVSFQLSVAATAGLILIAPPLNRALLARVPHLSSGPLLAEVSQHPAPNSAMRWLIGLVQDGLLVTLAANLAVTPLLLYHFQRLSLTTLPANLLIAPVQPAIMIGGLAAVLTGLAGATGLAAWLLWVPWLGINWTWRVVQWFAPWEGDTTWQSFDVGHAVIAYAVIILILARAPIVRAGQQLRMRLRTDSRVQPSASPSPPGNRSPLLHPTAAPVLVVLGVSTLLIWQVALSQPDGQLHVHFLDVGQGDAIFIQTPRGRQILIDGGRSPQQLQMALGQVLPFWDRTLDLMVLTHPDSDHMDAQITLPQRYRIGHALESATTATDDSHPQRAAWRTALDAAAVPVTQAPAGSWLDLGDGASLWVLWPPAPEYGPLPRDDNEQSLVLKLVYGNFSVLLTGDAGLPSEEMLVRQSAVRPELLTGTVLKVGHHGSRNSTGPGFTAAVQPWLAVIQVGPNTYGHPHAQVLENLQATTILRNDQHGTIHLRSDGARMWVQTGRGSH